MNGPELYLERMRVLVNHSGRFIKIVERHWDELPDEFKRDFDQMIEDTAALQGEIEE